MAGAEDDAVLDVAGTAFLHEFAHDEVQAAVCHNVDGAGGFLGDKHVEMGWRISTDGPWKQVERRRFYLPHRREGRDEFIRLVLVAKIGKRSIKVIHFFLIFEFLRSNCRCS